MKKWFKVIVFTGIGLTVVFFLIAYLTSPNSTTPPRNNNGNAGYPEHPSSYCSVEYLAREGGYIEGSATQTIKKGDDASYITAVAYDGYEFIGWSDANATEEKRADILNPTRHDKNITQDFKQIAYFRTPLKTFTYNYNGATSDTSVTNVTFIYHEEFFILPDLVIPTKEGYEFGGWYLEENFVTKAIDEKGNFMLGYGVFDTSLASENLYVKWTTPSDELVYKILMVFVDEVEAMLLTKDDTYVYVSYKMTGFEREILRKIPNAFARTLNEWFDGLVKFEVDMYFTTQTLTSFERNAKFVFANEIPEVNNMLLDYRSTLVTFSLNDPDNNLYKASGGAIIKHASINLDSILGRFYEWNLGDDLERLNSGETLNLDVYLHEFAHTVEWHYENGEIFQYHDALGYGNSNLITTLESTKLYLLGKYEIDGKNIGIPFSYWQGNVIMYVDYCLEGNYTLSPGFEPIMLIDGIEHMPPSVRQEVMFGRDAKEVTIIPPKGYRFTHWSDGQTNPTRKDGNILEHMSFTAYFEKLSNLNVEYGDFIHTLSIDSVKEDTQLKVWNFETSEIELANPTSIDSKQTGEYDIIHMQFSDGTEVVVTSGDYAFYDKTLERFVAINQDTVQFIGHKFNGGIYNPANGVFSLKEVELVSVSIEEKVYLKPNNILKTSENQAYFVNTIMAISSENIDAQNDKLSNLN